MIYDCIIIGAGAAGLFCGAAHKEKVNGLILEKTKKAGTKLLMSGNGQCNITHDGSIKDFISCYGKNGSKIRSCLYQYNNEHLRGFLHTNGVDTFVREDGKVFPKSMKAQEVRDMLLEQCKANGFSLKTGCEVFGLKYSDDVWYVKTDGSTYTAAAVVLATGGCSYPTTGSDGSFLEILKRDLDLDIIPPRPALSPLKTADYPFSQLAGISFLNAETSICHGEKRVSTNTGGLLLTHNDFSGPAVLNISKYGKPGDTLVLNYLYPLNYDTAYAKLKSAMNCGRESTANVLAQTFSMPKRFAKTMSERFGNSPKALAKGMTQDTFVITSIGSFNKAMATAGGIALSEVDTKTMKVNKHPNLYAIGEMLDVDGITGGYNLQFAYSSARAAANR